MDNKLQELTDKLYNEGLSKGKQEGEALLADARNKAAQIVENAQKSAEEIIAKARKDAEDLKKKAQGDLKMAAEQTLRSVKKDIEDLVISKITANELSKSMSSADFLKEIIRTVAEKFNTEEACDLNVIVPESLKKEIEPFIKNELSKNFKAGVSAEFSKKIAGGFKIGPKDGSWYISLTDETVKDLVAEFIRPSSKKILFGE